MAIQRCHTRDLSLANRGAGGPVALHVGSRPIEVSPFAEDGDKVFYFGGHDCASRPSHNTAWIYRAAATTSGSAHLK
jgi:hypothetical protein